MQYSPRKVYNKCAREAAAMLDDEPMADSELIEAVRQSDRERIDALLRAGADINARTNWWAGGFGVLDMAALDLAPFLIERGATVDVHSAARLGMMDKLRELVSSQPHLVHSRGGDGQTPLHFAKNVEIAEYLLAYDADIDALDVDHESTPAQYMLQKPDRSEVARYLVARGCKTDILMATALGDLELVRRHLDADPASVWTSVSDRYFPKRNPHAGGTIYIWAFGAYRMAHQIARDRGHGDVLALLMERSPDELKLVSACEDGDETHVDSLLPLSVPETVRPRIAYAAQNNNTEAVRLMLKAGWPVDAQGQHRGTALHWAAWHGNAAMVRELLRHNPPLEERRNDFDMTPLGWALHGSENGWYCKTGDYATTVELLLGAGAKAPAVTDGLEASEGVLSVLRRFAER